MTTDNKIKITTIPIGDIYIKKIRRKINALERLIHNTESTIIKENKTRERIWTNDQIEHKEKTKKIDESQKFVLQCKSSLASAYTGLADLKRMEANGLDQRASWLKNSDNYDLSQT